MLGVKFSTRRGDRGIRAATNTLKPQETTVSVEPSVSSMQEGEVKNVILNGSLYEYKKLNGVLWRKLYTGV